MKLDFKAGIENAKRIMVKNSPEILAGVSIVGMVGASVLSGVATAKAIRVLEEKHPDTKPTKVEIVKEVGKYYIPTAVAIGLSSFCIIKSDRIHLRRSAALATAYEITDTAYREYKNKVKGIIGEKKEKTVRSAIAKDIVENNPMPDNARYIETGHGTTRCYDTVFGQRFLGSIDAIQRIEAQLNLRMRDENYISVNELFYALGIPPIQIGDDLGWNSEEGNIEIMYDAQLDPIDNEPIIVISYMTQPRYDFHHRW